MRRAISSTAENGKLRTIRWSFSFVALLILATGSAAQEPDGASPAITNTSHETMRRVVVSIPDRKLAVIEDGRIIRVYPVAVGASATPSPTGTFKIANRIPEPTYYAPGKVIAPGPANPLGSRWIGLSLKGFGIHGTNEPRSIGRRASHGCIRMGKQDVEELFELVREGDTVELHGARTEELAMIFGSGDAAPQPAKPAAPAQVTALASAVVGN